MAFTYLERVFAPLEPPFRGGRGGRPPVKTWSVIRDLTDLLPSVYFHSLITWFHPLCCDDGYEANRRRNFAFIDDFTAIPPLRFSFEGKSRKVACQLLPTFPSAFRFCAARFWHSRTAHCRKTIGPLSTVPSRKWGKCIDLMIVMKRIVFHTCDLAAFKIITQVADESIWTRKLFV